MPSGRGRVALTRGDVAKRSIVEINNSDNLCFPRALVVAQTYNERGNICTGELHEKWKAIRYPHSLLPCECALQLTRSAGVVIPEEGCGIREIERFQRYFAADNIAIVVYNFNTFGRGEKPLYDGTEILASPECESSRRLNILYYEDSHHYNPILNLKAAAGTRDYCVACNVDFRNDRPNSHRCLNKCPRCFSVPPCDSTYAEIKCDACNRLFYGAGCFERHRSEKSYDGRTRANVCSIVRFCDSYGRIVKSNLKHECGVSYCKLCHSQQPHNHMCYMQSLRQRGDTFSAGPSSSMMVPDEIDISSTREEEARNIYDNAEKNERAYERGKGRVAFVFYDFKTRQDETVEGTGNIKKHIPTLCIAQQICEACAGENNMSV